MTLGTISGNTLPLTYAAGLPKVGTYSIYTYDTDNNQIPCTTLDVENSVSTISTNSFSSGVTISFNINTAGTVSQADTGLMAFSAVNFKPATGASTAVTTISYNTSTQIGVSLTGGLSSAGLYSILLTDKKSNVITASQTITVLMVLNSFTPTLIASGTAISITATLE